MVDSIEARLRKLEDRDAITQLLARYGPLADSGDADALAELWTESGSYDVGSFGEARGRSEIAELIRSPTHRELMQQGCAHILTVPVIELLEERAIAHNYSIVFRNTGDAFSAWRVSANRWELQSASNGWQVERRENAPLTGHKAASVLLALGGQLERPQ